MANFEITEVVVGEHPGWKRTYFDYQNRPWSLLVIENKGEAASLLSPQDEDKNQPWPHFHIMELHGIITPEAAETIILAVYAAFGNGKMEGIRVQRNAVRSVLGL